jgi:pyruvate formate lyase activating enzyme
MNFKGIDKFSLVDFPGKIACVLFVGGCNFRCPYCHNPHLVLSHSTQPKISEKSVLHFLESRKGKIEGIVISGGEPTLRKNVVAFARKVKDMGFLVKIDTNASCHERIEEMFEHKCLDAVGIDYKAPAQRYNEITKCFDKDLYEKIVVTIKQCISRKTFLEIKTTVHKKLLSFDDITVMRRELDGLGAKNWVLQQFHPADIIDESLKDEETYSDTELAKFAKTLSYTRARGIKGIFLE